MTIRTSKVNAAAKQRSIRHARTRMILWAGGLVVSGAGLVASSWSANADIFYVMLGALTIFVICLVGFLLDTCRLLDTRRLFYLFYGKILPAKRKKASPSDPQLRLMAAFGFDADELEANRQGYMAKSQRRRVYATRWDYVRRYGVAIVVSLVLYVGILVDGLQRGNISLAGAVLGTGIVGGFPILLVILNEDRRRRIKADLYKGDLESVSGRVQLSWLYAPGRKSGGAHRVSSRLAISGKIFEIHPVANDVFVEEDNYRVYYVPRSMSILSVEHLGNQRSGKHS